MKVIGFRTLAIARLTLPGDMRARSESDAAARIAASVESLALLQCPVVRRRGRSMILLAGRTRVAALIRLGRADVECKVVECSDLEAQKIELVENTDRKHLEKAELEEMRALLDKVEAEVIAEGVRPARPGRGRQKTPRGVALERVAKMTGHSLETIQAYEREMRRQFKALGFKADESPQRMLEPKLLDLGMSISPDFGHRVARIQVLLARARAGVVDVRLALGEMIKEQLPFPEVRHRALAAAAAELDSLLRSFEPCALCPYCKGLDGIQQHCAACVSEGWIGTGQVQGVPDKLWDQEEMIVLRDGRPVLVADLLHNGAAAAPANDAVETSW